MRKSVALLAALVSVVPLGVTMAAPSASAAEHPGCKGIDQAYSRASAQGRTSLAVVSQKFGCGTVVPDPVDTVACPSGQTSLARWTYAGTQTGPVEWGYPTWVGSWTNTAGTGAAVTYGDGGGFYWSEAVPGSVHSIVVQSMTLEVDVVTDVNPANAVSQNVFEDRTGFNLVNFCS